MKEAELLRTLADHLDRLDALKVFPADIGDPGELSLTWSEGAEHEGYGALNEAIGMLVKQHWAALRSQVVKQREVEVQTARKAWADHGQAKAEAA